MSKYATIKRELERLKGDIEVSTITEDGFYIEHSDKKVKNPKQHLINHINNIEKALNIEDMRLWKWKEMKGDYNDAENGKIFN